MWQIDVVSAVGSFFDVFKIRILFSLFIVIRVFELVPGASRQTEAVTITNKTTVERVAASRGGHAENQFIAFIDVNGDLFCTNSLINESNVEVQKIGERFLKLCCLFSFKVFNK